MEMKEMANQICQLTECGGIRSYFDDELDICVYDSAEIFNFFSCCEEVAYEIEQGNYKEAERLIKMYKGDKDEYL